MKKNKTLKMILTGVIVFLIIVAAGTLVYLKYALPSIPLKEIKVEGTSEQVARGEYLANHVMVCMDCHSTRAWDKFSGPIVPGTLGKGGEVFDQRMGFPGRFTAANITPFNLKEWTDAEIYRAITSGVNKKGEAIFPVMPYLYYGTLDRDDLFSVIAYIRSIPSIESHNPPAEFSFPMNFIVNMIPKPDETRPRPGREDTLRYGEYLVRASGCIECHTPAERGQIVKSRAYSGGRVFNMPDGTLLQSANITSDDETGIGRWSEKVFIFRFKSYDPSTFTPPLIMKGQMQTMMPWTMYAGMDTTDLASVYKYIHSLPPVKNKVAKNATMGK